MEERTVTHHRWNELPIEALSNSLARRLITGDQMMLAHVYLKKGCVVPRHFHENEQLTYILEGGLRFWIGADESQVIDVMAGEVLHIPANVPHTASNTSTANRQLFSTQSAPKIASQSLPATTSTKSFKAFSSMPRLGSWAGT